LLLNLICITTLVLISRRFTGHKTVALIAKKYLSLQAKTAIANLLNGQSMADVRLRINLNTGTLLAGIF